MLSRKQRLTASLVKRVLKNPKRFSGAAFACTWLPNREGYSRWAVVVSARLYTTAVERNRIRRKFYADVAEVLRERRGEVGVDAVCFLRSVSMRNLQEEVKQALRFWGMKQGGWKGVV